MTWFLRQNKKKKKDGGILKVPISRNDSIWYVLYNDKSTAVGYDITNIRVPGCRENATAAANISKISPVVIRNISKTSVPNDRDAI